VPPPGGGEGHFGGGREGREGRGGGDKPRGNQSRNRVWVLGTNGSLSVQRVSLGLSDGAKIQVLDGVDAATSIVVGVQVASEKSGQATSSPFMPQRNTKSGGAMKMR
jgi:hypothetical protein